MAHVQQLFDHMNQQFRRVYKEGVWVTSYITKIGRNSKGNVFFECIDAKKYNQGKPAASVVFRLVDPSLPSFRVFLDRLGLPVDFSDVQTFNKGEVSVAFKVVPNMHFERGLMPLIKDIAAYDLNIQLENLKSGIRIGVDNTQLKKPVNTGKPWSIEDNQKLEHYIVNSELSIESIGLLLKRTPLGCVEQAETLGVLKGKKLSTMRREAKSVTASIEQ